MASALPDLWPADVQVSDAVVSPKSLLEHQMRQLKRRSGGWVCGQVVQVEAAGRVRLRFEIASPDIEFRATLFEVEHRPDLVYPCVILPPAPLPEFLQAGVWRSGSEWEAFDDSGHWEENHWLASSHEEFIEKLRELLGRPEIKSTVNSLIAKYNEPSLSPPGDPDDNTEGVC